MLEGWNGRLHALSFEFDINETCNLQKRWKIWEKFVFESKMLHVKAKPLLAAAALYLAAGSLKVVREEATCIKRLC